MRASHHLWRGNKPYGVTRGTEQECFFFVHNENSSLSSSWFEEKEERFCADVGRFFCKFLNYLRLQFLQHECLLFFYERFTS
mmetsp:Transcript_6948/g.14297  ORF Transcript_6948/g.14297 Transcript_6948/m.14297 type:complete len:82 (-) Transcript_6948:110-355(-)